MTRYLLPALLLAGCMSTAGDPARSDLPDGFVGRPLDWQHASGAGGRMIHDADGTMRYDIRGAARTARWSYSREGIYCMNAGEPDADCFTLVVTPDGFASRDGNFRYTPTD